MANSSTSSDSTAPITLVVGGTSKTGRRVAERLSALGQQTRIASRGGDPIFDWQDKNTWNAVLDGATRAYIVHPQIASPTGQAETLALIKQGADMGLERVVVLTGRSGVPVEDEIAEVDVVSTFVRPGWFNQNFDEGFFVDSIRGGEIVLPVGEAAEAFVDADDIADVAVAALTEDKHAGQRYDLSGPRALNFTEIAAALTDAIGREIVYKPVSVEEHRALMREYGQPEEMTDFFVYSLTGDHSEPTTGVQDALGRPAKDFADYAREAAATAVWAV